MAPDTTMATPVDKFGTPTSLWLLLSNTTQRPTVRLVGTRTPVPCLYAAGNCTPPGDSNVESDFLFRKRPPTRGPRHSPKKGEAIDLPPKAYRPRSDYSVTLMGTK
jgi:hypothetical protein